MRQEFKYRLDPQKAPQQFLKHGKTPGYPRFKSFGRYHSCTYPPEGCWIHDGRLHLAFAGSDGAFEERMEHTLPP